MYTQYWNLQSSPFLNTDSEQLLYPADQLQEGVARLYYLIDQERIAGLLTGPYGVGKSFLLTCLVRRAQESGLAFIRFDAVPGGALPMAKHIMRAFGIEESPSALADALMILQEHCQDQSDNLQRHVLLIDEAQHLGDEEGLYLVHFLCNLRIRQNGTDKPLFTIILCGTPELVDRIHGYESLQRRIQLLWALRPYNEEQTVAYIQHHLHAVGGRDDIFTPESLSLVYRCTGGLPRAINNLCDTALMLGYAAQVDAITPDIVTEAAIDSGIISSEDVKR